MLFRSVLKSGNKDQYRHIVIVHACHEVAEISTIWVGDENLGTLDANGNCTTGKYANQVRVKKHLGTSDDPADASLISECPDYWKLSKNEDGHVRCKPEKKNAEYASPYGFYSYQLPTKMNKYEYAIKNKITWDGITNDQSLINNYKDEAPKSILWLLSKVFTVQNNSSN